MTGGSCRPATGLRWHASWREPSASGRRWATDLRPESAVDTQKSALAGTTSSRPPTNTVPDASRSRRSHGSNIDDHVFDWQGGQLQTPVWTLKTPRCGRRSPRRQLRVTPQLNRSFQKQRPVSQS